MSLISAGGGIAVIHALQRLPIPGLHAAFTVLSFLGEEHFFLVFLPVLLWTVDARLGLRATVGFLLSVYVNDILKDLWHQPRPFVLDPTIVHPAAVGSGMPSGHAQSAMVVWGMMALGTRRGAARAVCLALILLVGLSRVYLGVHLPSQVLVGWLVGAVLLAAIPAASTRWARPWRAMPQAGRLAAALALPVALALAHPDGDTAASMGVLAGLGAGLTAGSGPWEMAGRPRDIGMRLLVGLGVLLLLYFGLSALLPKEGQAWYQPLRFLRYAALGLWVGRGAPWLFTRLGGESRAVAGRP